MKYRWVYAVLAITGAVIPNGSGAPAPDWRDDKANIEIVRELNRAYRRVPFSTEYEGVSDNCPIEIDWTVGPDLPLPGKGSVSGLFGDEIVIAAGAWLDNKPRSLAFNFKTGSYGDNQLSDKAILGFETVSIDPLPGTSRKGFYFSCRSSAPF